MAVLFGMKHYCYSKLHDCYYLFDGCIKILNLKQALFYACEGVQFKDIYPSLNYQTGRRNLIFIVDKFESMSAYNRWKKIQKGNFEWNGSSDQPGPEDQNLTRLLNINQVIFYMERKVKLRHCLPAIDSKTGEPVLAFYFDRDETREISKEWKSRSKK